MGLRAQNLEVSEGDVYKQLRIGAEINLIFCFRLMFYQD